jgi:hypothetical protein
VNHYTSVEYEFSYKTLEKNKMSKRILWSVEVLGHLNEDLEKYIEIDSFKTKSELIITAVRDRLTKKLEKIKGNNK